MTGTEEDYTRRPTSIQRQPPNSKTIGNISGKTRVRRMSKKEGGGEERGRGVLQEWGAKVK